MDEFKPGNPFALLAIGVSSSGKTAFCQYLVSNWQKAQGHSKNIYVVNSKNFPNCRQIDYADVESLPPSSLCVFEDVIRPSEYELGILKLCLCEYRHHKKQSFCVIIHTVFKNGMYALAGFFTHLSIPKREANRLIFSNVARALNLTKNIWGPAWLEFITQPDGFLYLIYNVGTSKFNTYYVHFSPHPPSYRSRTTTKASKEEGREKFDPPAILQQSADGASGQTRFRQRNDIRHDSSALSTTVTKPFHSSSSKELALLLRQKLVPILQACATEEHKMRALAFFDFLMAGTLDPCSISLIDLALYLSTGTLRGGTKKPRRVSICDYIFYVTSLQSEEPVPLNCLLLHQIILRQGVAIPHLFIKNDKFASSRKKRKSEEPSAAAAAAASSSNPTEQKTTTDASTSAIRQAAGRAQHAKDRT